VWDQHVLLSALPVYTPPRIIVDDHTLPVFADMTPAQKFIVAGVRSMMEARERMSGSDATQQLEHLRPVGEYETDPASTRAIVQELHWSLALRKCFIDKVTGCAILQKKGIPFNVVCILKDGSITEGAPTLDPINGLRGTAFNGTPWCDLFPTVLTDMLAWLSQEEPGEEILQSA
jgi:hypothetical protein